MANNFEQFSIVWLKSAHKNFQKLPISDQKAITKQICISAIGHRREIYNIIGH